MCLKAQGALLASRLFRLARFGLTRAALRLQERPGAPWGAVERRGAPWGAVGRSGIAQLARGARVSARLKGFPWLSLPFLAAAAPQGTKHDLNGSER